MPALEDPKHEAMAKGLAMGKTADKAYSDAGYRPHRGNASRLSAKESIQRRVVELTEKLAEKAIASISFEAKDLFARMENLIQKCMEAGDYKTAMDGLKFELRCFGYEDSPTLTHEHVKGQAIQPVEVKDKDDRREETRDSVIKNFAEEIKKLRKRTS